MAFPSQINRRAMEQAKQIWNRSKAEASKRLLTLQRVVKRMGRARRDGLLSHPELYEGHLAKDIVSIPGAAAMVGVVEYVIEECRPWRPYDVHNDDERGDSLLGEYQGQRWVKSLPPSHAPALAAVEGWRGLCAPDADYPTPGTPYRSLSRTLARLPTGLPSSLVAGLRSVRLERPLTSRLSIAAVSAMADPDVLEGCASVGQGQRAAVGKLMHATDEQPADLVAGVAPLVVHPLSARRALDLKHALGVVAAAAIDHCGPLRTLVRKSGFRGPEPSPPVPPRCYPGVRLLRTATEIVEEGREMRHCSASYMQLILSGQTHILSVSYKGRRATVEVNAEGRLVQARGPANSRKAGSRRGEGIGAAWAERLRASRTRRAC
ncbi:MAG: PcfJ domain-containing protein [Planctomycetota bacterium]